VVTAGLVSKVVPADKTVDTALEIAAKIASFGQVGRWWGMTNCTRPAYSLCAGFHSKERLELIPPVLACPLSLNIPIWPSGCLRFCQAASGALCVIFSLVSQPVTAACKETVNAAYEMTLAEGLRFERRIFHALFATVGVPQLKRVNHGDDHAF
jgi:enoyl-CoA hydratase/carnithine racemase